MWNIALAYRVLACFAEGNRVNQGVAASSSSERCLSAPHLGYSNPSSTIKESLPQCGRLSFMVEPRGIEPLSEGNLTRLSPSAVCYLHSLIPAGTNTLRDLVAS